MRLRSSPYSWIANFPGSPISSSGRVVMSSRSCPRIVPVRIATRLHVTLWCFADTGALDIIARANRRENLVAIAINKASGVIHICEVLFTSVA
jgi:hypothetical protein